MEKTIYVIAEHGNGKISPITYELLGFATQLQEFRRLPVSVLMLGRDVGEAAESLAASEGVDVTVFEIPEPGYYNGEMYREILVRFFETVAPAFICAGHTATGTDVAPGLALRLNAANITAVRGIARHEDHLCFDRSIYNGERTARVLPRTKTVLLNILPGLFRRTGPVSPCAGTVQTRQTEYNPHCLKCTGIKAARKRPEALSGADVVVSAGNGVGSEENIALIQRLAELFPKSAVAGSRIVCDRGWLPYDRQVGVTGTTIAPKLYIACGVSGAPQHLCGMSGSEFIVAVNTDARASIRNVSDVYIQEDLVDFIPLFIETCANAASDKETSHD